jgi:hypothetical protein
MGHQYTLSFQHGKLRDANDVPGSAMMSNPNSLHIASIVVFYQDLSLMACTFRAGVIDDHLHQ